MPRMTERRAWTIYGAAWCVWHLLVFLSAPDTGLHIWNHEEAMSGNLARALVEGLALPAWHYQYAHHTHGTFVYGLVLAPIFALGGSSILWVKALGLAFAAAGTALWIALVRRAFGPRAAGLFAAWWLLAPPALVHMQHLAWANHMESIAWIGAMLLVFAGADDAEPSPGRFAFLGGIAGFASFFCLQSLLVAVPIAMLTVWRWRRAAVRPLAAAAPAFVVAYSPHWFYARAMYRPLNLEAQHPDLIARARAFAAVVPEALEYHWRAATWLAVAVVAVALAFAIGDFAHPARRHHDRSGPWVLRALVLHVAAFFAANVLSTFAVEPYALDVYRYRYVTPLFPSAMALAAWAFSTRPRIAACVFAPLLIAGAYDARAPQTVASVAAQLRNGTPGAWMWELRGDNMRPIVEQNAPFAWGNALELRGDREETWRGIAGQIARLPTEWRALACETLALDRGDQAPAFVRASCGPTADVAWRRGLGRRELRGVFNGMFEDPDPEAVGRVFERACGSGDAEFARGFAYEYLAQYEVRTHARFRIEDAEPTRDAIASLLAHAGDEMCAGATIAYGMGRVIAELELDPAPFTAVARFTPLAPTPERAAEFESGYASGTALALVAKWRCAPRDLPLLRTPQLGERLADMGLRLDGRGARMCLARTDSDWTAATGAPTMP